MSDANELVTRYLAAWNETDAARRAERIKELWVADGSYVDPLAEVSGHDAISAVIGGVQQQFPGFTFELAKAAEEHHGRVRFSWGLVAEPGAEPTVIGTDVAVLAADGRLRDVHGFLDKVPAA
ncbi:MAG TPA: nuclear transport factor 2 family protein [Pseudonocardiaceae bacterium]|nr:nuclear transport factor 2 family protein [Pseudonocardiaceae bacterium]